MNSPVVEARELCKSIRGRMILDHLGCSAAAGDIVGVLGKNGAGKTTLLETLLGFGPVSSGSSRLFGADSVSLPAAIRISSGGSNGSSCT